jgi:hypothetical protein
MWRRYFLSACFLWSVPSLSQTMDTVSGAVVFLYMPVFYTGFHCMNAHRREQSTFRLEQGQRIALAGRNNEKCLELLFGGLFPKITVLENTVRESELDLV